MADKEVTIKVVPFVSADKWHNWKAIFLARIDKKDPKVGEVFNLSKEYELTKKVDGRAFRNAPWHSA